MKDTNDRIIDLTRLGFEIAVPATDERGSTDHAFPQLQEGEKDALHKGGEDPAGENNQTQEEWLPDYAGGYKLTIDADDNVSCMSYDTYDGFDDDDDDSYVLPTQNMPTKTFPRRSEGLLSNVYLGYESALPSNADLGYADLGYGGEESAPSVAFPSMAEMGYGGDEAVTSSNQLIHDEDTVGTLSTRPSASSVLSLLSVGRPIRNRRSMGMGQCRRFTNESKVSAGLRRRHSSCSASTASSGKMRQAHRRSHNGVSQRERMVSRSTSRRLSRQHPTQIPLVSTAQDNAAQQILQHLGCSEVFFDSRRRMSSRVSLEYGNDGTDSVDSRHHPKSISLEFDNSNHSGKGGSRLPRRVSIQYEQQATCQGDNQTNGQFRRGSLVFSTGTSCLPRRSSLSRSHHSERRQSSPERNPDRPNNSRTPPRPVSDTSLRSLSTRISRRTSIANVPRQQMRDAAFGAAANKQTMTAKPKHRRVRSLGSSQYRTLGAVIGSSA